MPLIRRMHQISTIVTHLRQKRMADLALFFLLPVLGVLLRCDRAIITITMMLIMPTITAAIPAIAPIICQSIAMCIAITTILYLHFAAAICPGSPSSSATAASTGRAVWLWGCQVWWWAGRGWGSPAGRVVLRMMAQQSIVYRTWVRQSQAAESRDFSDAFDCGGGPLWAGCGILATAVCCGFLRGGATLSVSEA